MTWKQRWRQEGGGRELLRLALPLILSSSFLTLQISIDRALLSHFSSDAVAAAMPAAMLYWTPFLLLQNIANYAMTFVAQYTGAGRPERVGPAVWQALYFAVVAGVAFIGLWPLAPHLAALGAFVPDPRVGGGLFSLPVFCGIAGLDRGGGQQFFRRTGG